MTTARLRTLALASLLALAPAVTAAEPNLALIGFEAGPKGWSINGLNTPTATGGNPGARLYWNDPVDTFGLEIRTSTHPAFIGDYTAKGEVTLGLDVQVGYIQFFTTKVPRDLVVILFDDDSVGGAPPASVWTYLGTLDGKGMPWTHFSATVTDVLSDTLPAGWFGAGAEDPVTFEPILPAGRTWSNVLAGVDRIQFTTYVPGYFYGFTNFDLSVDNVSIAPSVPAWTNQGFALAGVSGEPSLTGDGTLVAGSANAITLANAAPSATAGLFVATAGNPTPFKGGTLVPVPFLGPVMLVTSPTGGFSLPFAMPAGVPAGTELWLQAAIQDAAAVKGVALSNAIKGLVP